MAFQSIQEFLHSGLHLEIMAPKIEVLSGNSLGWDAAKGIVKGSWADSPFSTIIVSKTKPSLQTASCRMSLLYAH